MYWGRATAKLDTKNRVPLPSQFRKLLGDRLLIANWFEKSIVVLPRNHMEEMLADLRNASIFRKDVRDLELFIFGGSEEVTVDSHGRILIPHYLKEHADITTNVIFTGGIDYIRLWDKEYFENYRGLTTLRAGSIAENMAELIEKKQ